MKLHLKVLIITLILTQIVFAQSNIKSFDLLNMGSEAGGFSFSQKPQQISAFNAQTPVISITGADKPIPVGELVVLNAAIDSKPSNLHSVAYSWTVLPKREVIVWPDGTKAVFGTGTSNQTYTVILTTSFVYAVKDNEKITDIIQRSMTQTVIVNIDNGQTPPPTEPTTPEDPSGGTNANPPLSGLPKLASDWTNLVIRNESNQDEDIKLDAANLAKAFRTIADQIDNKVLTDINSIMGASKTLNDGAIKHKLEWLPWFAKVSEYVESSYKDGSMREVSQYSKAWKEIAIGLEYIGN